MKNKDFIFIKKMIKKRRAFKQYLKINGIVVCRIEDTKISKNTNPYIPPVFDKNSFGWNQELQDLFKEFPPIPQIKKDEPSSLSYFTSLLIKHKIDNNEVDEQQKNELLDMLNKEKLNYTTNASIPENILEYELKNLPYQIKLNNNDFNLEAIKSQEVNITKDKKILFWDSITSPKLKEIPTEIISLDWDDVMYHLMQKNIEFVEKMYGIKDIHNVITDYYYLYRKYPMIADMLWNHPENYISGDLVDGALEFYRELTNLVGEHRIQIVTSSMENVIPLKDKMIKERFGINCKIVHAIFGKYKKHEFTKNTLLIDDHVGNILDHENHNGYKGIVFNHMKLNYIKELSMKHNLIYTTTFEEVLVEVKKIFKIKD